MKFDIDVRIDVHHHYGEGTIHMMILTKLEQILAQGRTIMATQAELTQQVKAATEKITKIGTETTTLVAKVKELTDIITNGPPVTPELQAAVDELKAQAQVVDDLVSDQPTP